MYVSLSTKSLHAVTVTMFPFEIVDKLQLKFGIFSGSEDYGTASLAA
jgi:hypothetical protein